MPADTCKRTIRQKKWIRIVQKNGFPKLNSFWLHLTLKKAIWR
jgi:hypothetical protein